MNQANEHDLGPLTWVKGEIDQALAHALEAIDQAAAGEEERGSRLQFAQSHLHQARGALSIIGLDGLTQFADGVDKLLGALARGELELSEEMVELCRRAIAATGNYLDELSHGAPDQPLRLAQLHARVALARRTEPPGEGELFYPDLNLRIPRRPPPPPLEAADEVRLRRWLRVQFQQGLLAWMRNNNDTAGARRMREALAGIESRQNEQAARAFWLAATGFCEVLAEGHVHVSPHIRRLCGRLDLQIRRVLSGATHFPERLHRDTLYIVARAPATSPLVRALHSLYQLPSLLPPPNSAVSEMPLAPLLAELREQLGHAKEAWNQFAEGAAAALPSFEERMAKLAVASRKLGRPAFVRLMSTLSAFAQWLRKDPLRLTEAISMEVASALLLADHALESGRVPDASFSSQVEDVIGRIEACSRGETLAAHDAGATARQAQERSAVAQLCKEVQASLAQIEQTLDAFFRAPDKREGLAAVRTPIGQIEAILTLLGETEAHDALSECDAMVARLADPDQEPDTGLFEPLADRLSALGFYIDSLRSGRPELHHLTGDAPAPAADDEPALELDALPELAPAAAELPAEAAALPALDTPPAEPAVQHEEDLPEAPVPIPAPSAEATQLIEASEDEIDAELLDIFIEEAREVLAQMEQSLATVRANPADADTLTVIRRGFHTLKGSGRMVGLNALGEVAWAMEQTLNRWLQLEWRPNEALLALIERAHPLFAAWVEQLAGGGSTARDDTQPVVDAAQRLLEIESPDAAETVSEAEPALPETDLEAVPSAEPAATPETTAEASQAPEASEFTEAASQSLTETALEMSDLEATDLSMAGLAPLDLGLSELDGAEATLVEPLELLEDEDESGHEAPEAEAEADTEIAWTVQAEEAGDEDQAPVPAPDEATHAARAASAAAIAMLTGTRAPAPVEPEGTAPQAAFEPDEAEVEPAALEYPEMPAAPEAAEAQGDAAEIDFAVAAEEDETDGQAALEEESDTVDVGEVRLSRGLYSLFVTEARQHLAELRREAAQLQTNPTRVPQEAALRAAHTMAGISGTAGFAPTQSLGRALEHALARLHETHTAPGGEQAALLATATDTLDAMVGEIERGTLPLSAPELEEQLDSLLRTPIAEVAEAAPAPAPAAEAAPLATEASPDKVEPEVLDMQDDVDAQLLPIFIEEAEELLVQLNARLREWRQSPGSTELHAAIARLLHTLKGSARMTGAMVLGEHLHALEGRLEVEDAASNALLDELEQGIDLVTQAIERLGRGESTVPAAPSAAAAAAEAPAAVAIEAEDSAGAASATLRVRADTVDRFVNEAGEIGIARTRIEGELRTQRRALLDLTENVIRLRNQLREVEIQADIQMQSRMAQAESTHANFDPLEMDRYTRLQELTRMMAESVNDVTTVQHALLRNLDSADAALTAQGRMTRDLQQTLMSVRMTPFEGLADRLYRVVRQSAKDLGKRANLDLRGGRIELDRSVLERITGPLEHLLRNAVAHGIETPEARRAAGKPEIGEIALTVRHEGNEVVVDMADDGAGLDFARIERRAREAGLLAEGEQPDERRLTNMIFMPGFSTAEALSQVSGRGVGMDVVKAEVASVGGRIEITSTAGHGTRIQLYLPLTLAVTQALLVRAAGRTYAIPSNMVAQVLELKPDALAAFQAEGGTTWMENEYRYTYLPRLLGDAATQPEVHRFNWVLLLRSGSQTAAVHVDALRGNQEIVVKKAGPQLARMVGYAGATVLGDGEVVLILNPIALAGAHQPLEDGAATAQVTALEAERSPTVMVVDDSLTVRKITGRLLEREGYTVLTAKDGVDALEQLLETVPDVILSDIEMPRMDGFDLARNIRNDDRLKSVPIVMITSRLADKHRQYASQIGVNHYLGKPYQEDELLDLISRYAGQTVVV